MTAAGERVLYEGQGLRVTTARVVANGQEVPAASIGSVALVSKRRNAWIVSAVLAFGSAGLLGAVVAAAVSDKLLGGAICAAVPALIVCVALVEILNPFREWTLWISVPGTGSASVRFRNEAEAGLACAAVDRVCRMHDELLVARSARVTT